MEPKNYLDIFGRNLLTVLVDHLPEAVGYVAPWRHWLGDILGRSDIWHVKQRLILDDTALDLELGGGRSRSRKGTNHLAHALKRPVIGALGQAFAG